MNNNFKPFMVTFGIQTPIQVSPYPIMLDGLLYYVIEQLHHLEDNKDGVVEILSDLLDCEQGVFKASSALLVRNDTRSITTGVASHPTCIDWENYPFELSKRKVLVVKSGPYRNRMTKYTTIMPLAVRFYGVGDAEKLRFYFQSVFGLGRSYNQGYGQVGSMVLTTIDRDQSWYGDATGIKTLHRHLPVGLVENGNVDVDLTTLEKDMGNLYVPYHLDSEGLCYRPTKTLIVIDNDY